MKKKTPTGPIAQSDGGIQFHNGKPHAHPIDYLIQRKRQKTDYLSRLRQ